MKFNIYLILYSKWNDLSLYTSCKINRLKSMAQKSLGYIEFFKYILYQGFF